MSLVQEIDDIYVKYCLLDQDIRKLCSQHTSKSRAILKRYIDLKENLSPELFPLLQSRKLLPQSFALTLCKTIKNPLHQVHVYHSLQGAKTSEKIENLANHTNCLICCDNSSYHEYMNCCGQWLCTRCFKECLIQSMTNLTLTSLACPFCRCDVPLSMIRDFTISTRCKINGKCHYKSLEPWRNSYEWIQSVSSNDSVATYRLSHYLHNLYQLYVKYTTFLSENPDSLETNHIGYCYSCIQSQYQTMDNFKRTLSTTSRRKIRLERIHLATVQKDCANDEQLKPEIFRCHRCTEGNTKVKRCPHCGVKSIRPNGCNYVRCVCGNHWCFVCNMRLPHSHEGHNVHYWIANGSSAYDDNCRVSSDHHGVDYVVDGCSCRYCSKRGGAPLCATLDCSNTVPKKPYTTEHGRTFQWGLYCDECC
jgi:hypothetical protein